MNTNSNNTDTPNIPNKQMPKIGIAGFKNIGNTCYMNSVLQLLIHCKPIISFLMDETTNNPNSEDDVPKYIKYLNHAGYLRIKDKIKKENKFPDNFNFSVPRQRVEHFVENSITKQLATIINLIMTKGNSKITPNEFKSSLEKKIPIFKGFQQHDSHELLLQLLDNMFEETGIESEPMINNVPEIIKDYLSLLSDTKDKLALQPDADSRKEILNELNEFKKSNEPVINRYGGLKFMMDEYKSRYNQMIYQIKSFNINTITCLTCQNYNSNYESNTILSIPVKSTIDECLEAFVKADEIDDYNCKYCECKRKATKTTQIYKTPMILFLHLKRFRQLSNGRVLKDDRYVEIPPIIDLNPYCDLNMIPEQNLSNKYILKGISNHHGGLGGGHYTANCAGLVDPENWYNFDDSHVSMWENNNINTSDAYILMYEMIFD